LNKVIYVPAFFTPTGENVTKKVPTGEKEIGFFGGEKDVTKDVEVWLQTGHSDCRIDGERLANDITQTVNELNQNGYEVVTVTPVTSGEHKAVWRLQKGAPDWGHRLWLRLQLY